MVAVAGRGDASLMQIAKDFGISESCLHRWMRRADIDDGVRPGVTSQETAEGRELKRRVRVLEQENEILRRAAVNSTGQRNKLRGSMGRVGACADNAAMESFFSLLQKNVLNRQRRETRQELRIAIITWIERTYHRRRRQRRLGRLTPIEYETLITAAHAARTTLNPESQPNQGQTPTRGRNVRRNNRSDDAHVLAHAAAWVQLKLISHVLSWHGSVASAPMRCQAPPPEASCATRRRNGAVLKGRPVACCINTRVGKRRPISWTRVRMNRSTTSSPPARSRSSIGPSVASSASASWAA